MPKYKCSTDQFSWQSECIQCVIKLYVEDTNEEIHYFRNSNAIIRGGKMLMEA
jgi:hypothetical protein